MRFKGINTIFVILLLGVFLLLRSNLVYAEPSQRALVMDSCLLGQSDYFPPRLEHTRLCATLRFRQFMPLAPYGWVADDINWLIKPTAEHRPFREGAEMQVMFENYGIYPFIKYIEKNGSGKIYVMGTEEPEKFEALTHQLDKKEQQLTSLNEEIRYFIDENPRISALDATKSWYNAHILIKNRLYLILYVENVKDNGMITALIESIRYEGMTTLQ